MRHEARILRLILGGLCAAVPLLTWAIATSNPVSSDETARAAPPTVEERPTLPTDVQLTELIRRTLDAVDYGDKSGNYLGLYLMLTPDVQRKVDMARLGEALAGFRKLNVDLSPTLRESPQFDRPPNLTGEGLLLVRGTFDHTLRPIRFDFGYRHIDGNWRIQVFNLDAAPLAGKTMPADTTRAGAATTGAQPTTSAEPTTSAATMLQAPPPRAPNSNAPGIPSPYLDKSTDPPTASKW